MTSNYPTAPDPWAQGEGFGAQPARPTAQLGSPADESAPATFPTYQPQGGELEPLGTAPAQFPGATRFQPTYGQSNPYSLGEAPEHPNATTSLVLGIIGLFFPIVSPFAWYLGGRGRRDMREQPGRYRESSSLTAGWVMGIIGSLLLMLGVLMMVIMLGAFILFAAS